MFPLRTKKNTTDLFLLSNRLVQTNFHLDLMNPVTHNLLHFLLRESHFSLKFTVNNDRVWPGQLSNSIQCEGSTNIIIKASKITMNCQHDQIFCY